MKTRFREQKRWFRKSLMVLQVGIESRVGVYVSPDGDDQPPPNWDENATYTCWRDATVEDLLVLGDIRTFTNSEKLVK